MKAKRLLQMIAALMVAATANGAEVAKPQDEAAQPFVTYDNQGRMVRHVTFDPDGNILQLVAYEYIDDEITLETTILPNGTNGWTVIESLNMEDSGVRLSSVSEYDADSALIDEKLVVIRPGSRPFRIPEDL
ncbi:MAG: hypothetical protein AB7T27_04115 [Kiritimatiellia bacterium]